jgi:hypothetical protein
MTTVNGSSPTAATTSGPVVQVTAEVKRALDAYIAVCNTEISGFGLIDRLPGGILRVTKLYLPEQVCSGSDTEVSLEHLSTVFAQVAADGHDTAKLRLWWHSHVDMGVFWSSTDDTTAKDLAENGGGWFLSIVGNKRGEYKCRLDMNTPFRILWDNIPVSVVVDQTDAFLAAIQVEVAEKVSTRTFAVGGFQRSSDQDGVGNWYSDAIADTSPEWDPRRRHASFALGLVWSYTQCRWVSPKQSPDFRSPDYTIGRWWDDGKKSWEAPPPGDNGKVLEAEFIALRAQKLREGTYRTPATTTPSTRDVGNRAPGSGLIVSHVREWHCRDTRCIARSGEAHCVYRKFNAAGDVVEVEAAPKKETISLARQGDVELDKNDTDSILAQISLMPFPQQKTMLAAYGLVPADLDLWEDQHEAMLGGLYRRGYGIDS